MFEPWDDRVRKILSGSFVTAGVVLDFWPVGIGFTWRPALLCCKPPLPRPDTLHHGLEAPPVCGDGRPSKWPRFHALQSPVVGPLFLKSSRACLCSLQRSAGRQVNPIPTGQNPEPLPQSRMTRLRSFSHDRPKARTQFSPYNNTIPQSQPMHIRTTYLTIHSLSR